MTAYWYLTPPMKDVLHAHVRNTLVYDIGAGDLSLSKLMAKTASEVIAIEPYAPSHALPKNVTLIKDYLTEVSLPDTLPVVMLSWPTLYEYGITGILAQAEKVMVIANMFGGTSCGSQEMWESLMCREVIDYYRHPKNTLIVYGNTSSPRPLLREEKAVLDLMPYHGDKWNQSVG